MKPQKVIVNDLMQRNYFYYLTEPTGTNFDPKFLPQLTPQQMLEMGVFGGKYITDCRDEFSGKMVLSKQGFVMKDMIPN